MLAQPAKKAAAVAAAAAPEKVLRLRLLPHAVGGCSCGSVKGLRRWGVNRAGFVTPAGRTTRHCGK